MIIKFIQVNAYKGKYLNDLVDFLKKASPDIVTMQEITSGVLNFWEDKNVSLFEDLRDKLALNGAYGGDITITGSEKSKSGNAVFSRFEIIKNMVIPLRESFPLTEEQFHDSKVWPNFPRNLLDVSLKTDSGTIHALTFHGAWTAPPTDTDETMSQARVVADHLKSLKEPYVMGVDFNAIVQSRTVGIVNEVANNWMMNSGVRQTTHVSHKIGKIGYLVDYVFTSSDFKLKSLVVPTNVLVTDHLPVIAELEL